MFVADVVKDSLFFFNNGELYYVQTFLELEVCIIFVFNEHVAY